MRWMRWLGVGLGVAALACGGVAFAFRDTLTGIAGVFSAVMEEPDWTEIPDADRFLAYLEAHPDTVSLIAYTAGPDGQPIPDSRIEHAADTPLVLASTMKIVVLSAVARSIDEGSLAADAPIRLEDWDSWYLPGMDGGAHPSAYDRLEIAHDSGRASDPAATVPLSMVVGAMIQESDNAATDTLIALLGDRMDRETEILGHAPLQPLLGGMLHALDAEPCAGSAPDLSDPATRRARIDAGVRPGTLATQRAGLECTLPRGTARTYARIQAGVSTGTHISPTASAWMADHLDWPMDFPSNQEKFETFGTKGGSVPGVLTEASYLVPKSGDHAGEHRVVAVFANQMSGSAWIAGMGSYAHQAFIRRLATDRAFEDEVRARLADR
ncbi:MAG: serine hydrolase [Myxococcota bacterium]